MKSHTTADGSLTFYNEEFKEHYHGPWGAREEAFIKYVDPCKVEERDSVVILDVCFGLGYNSAAAIERKKPGAHMLIVGLENDKAILEKIKEMEYPFSCKELIVEAIEKGSATKDGVTLIMIVGDAREIIKQVGSRQTAVRRTSDVVRMTNASQNASEQSEHYKLQTHNYTLLNSVTCHPLPFFDVVLFDPFSPRKCPQLWTAEFFKDVFAVMSKGGILTTYSCARHIRDNMKAVGLSVEDGPVFGRRGPGTIARKK